MKLDGDIAGYLWTLLPKSRTSCTRTKYQGEEYKPVQISNFLHPLVKFPLSYPLLLTIRPSTLQVLLSFPFQLSKVTAEYSWFPQLHFIFNQLIHFMLFSWLPTSNQFWTAILLALHYLDLNSGPVSKHAHKQHKVKTLDGTRSTKPHINIKEILGV